ncbi:MAG: hypothetical protein DMG12_20845 [Acidobacteria bacterium]|nr:MAG: hypothetical protein DMG12_20845 [Acidobacteriota bacterium]
MFNFRVYERPSFYLTKIRPDTKLDLLKGKQLYEGTIPLHLAPSFTCVRRCMMSKGGQWTTPVSSLFDWPLFARQDVRIVPQGSPPGLDFF